MRKGAVFVAIVVMIILSVPSGYALITDVSNTGNYIGTGGITQDDLPDFISTDSDVELVQDGNDFVLDGDGDGHISDTNESFSVSFEIAGYIGFCISLILDSWITGPIDNLEMAITYYPSEGVQRTVTYSTDQAWGTVHYYSLGNLDGDALIPLEDIRDVNYVVSYGPVDVTISGYTRYFEIQMGVVFDHTVFE